ncbi:DNA-binding transcriptional regulator, FadR family [Gracilibacillus orientalis]|uniref:DNA-binding transcriptional regulator, FadR family n=1 Tax=Gracilibacillus orientalis TaxID=334253 RepID=A0A1I4JU84_9BACI|nr:FadR/GntR family transcriptional regulator [Gracilibacillus orientalis]SFL70024.1 DNA-binding transcriptional regulator, FadR family [Gracilibacillus orientalis]
MMKKKKLIYEIVYEEIKKNIREGKWQAGEKIPTVQALSQQLNVSISSVREAIKILSQQRILRVEQGRGTFVETQLSENPNQTFEFLENSSMEQLTEARLVIEPELAAIVAERGSEDEVKRILQCARVMQRKMLASEDFLEEDIEFHYLIAQATKNDVLLKMMTLISDLLYDSRRYSMKIKSQNEKAANYHILIARAIKDKNPFQARNLMNSHILDLLDDLKKRPR